MSRKTLRPQALADRKIRLDENPIVQRLRSLSLLARRTEKLLGERLGVNITDLAAMEHLLTHGPLTPSDLAARLQVTTAAGTQIVDRLERVGHASRERQAEDRRKVLVVPAEASVEQVYQLLAPMMEGLESLVARLREPEREVIERFLDQVLEVYRATARSLTSPSPPSE